MKRVGLFLPVVALLVIAGCDDPRQPEAIWGDTGKGPGQMIYPRAICAAANGSVFVVDRYARVQHWDREGKYLNEWQMPNWQLGKPVGLSVGPDGNVYVADTHYHRIAVYTPGGQFLREWGREGAGPGEFMLPTDVAFDAKGRIFVSEYNGNDRVQVFDSAGKWLFQFGRFGQGDGEFARPESLAIIGDLVYIADACNHRIAVFTTDGRFVRNMGRLGSELGELRFPYGLDHDSKGNLVVCEMGNNRVQLMDRQTGRGLGTWGRAGGSPGELMYPWAAAVDGDNRVLVVDSGNNRVQVFRW